jgi:glucose-6-phosphate-specific signal transduction histidine kinase
MPTTMVICLACCSTGGACGWALTARDNGRGGAAFGRGSGLAGLKDRIEALGGRISLHSPPGAGTTLQIALPLSGLDGPGWES